MHLISWKCIVVPKALGGWGLKIYFHFSKALVAKVPWRLITTSILWTEVVQHKYIAPRSLLDWLRNIDKRLSGVSIIWKAVIKSFDLISQGLVWKVGNGWNLWIR